MRFSVWPNTDVKFDELATTVEVSERLGFFAAYLPDHLMSHGPAELAQGDVLESTVTLAALAAKTASIRLGILVAAATFRHPAVYAKSLCAIDHISGGRAIAGIGAGWEENEHESFGISLGSTTERVNRLEEYVTVVASMLANDVTSFEGNYFELRDARCDPRPVQSPLPILLGVRGRHRTMGIAARHATLWNAWSTPEDLVELNQTLDDWCERVGRPPTDLQRTVNTGLFLSDNETWLRPFRDLAPGGPALVGNSEEVAEIVNRYRMTQCDELILAFDTDGTTRHLDMLALFMEEVVPVIAQ
jgi:alkanesulfonate monooxygenase SsuD/methylene tetrahydromethanopterin reductase-like flavin-dependent oxidoreductase (luciferase family)